MTRIGLENYISENFGTGGEQLFARYPSHRVYRHGGSGKWFAVIMDIPGSCLGLGDRDMLSVVNLKCEPMLIGSFREEPGIFPGWHMNKNHWLSVALDGTASEESLKFLLDMSYELTKK